jgi:catechol 2,3-dioxygenase-like lactoylglutathione lyase family enzyme
MRLNHLNLTVDDVPIAQQFMEKYFGFHAFTGNRNIAVMQGDGGFILSLTSLKVGGETSLRYPANFHIGFGVESMAKVNALNDQLRADGYDVPAASVQHGAWTFYFQAPGGFTIEVMSNVES